MEFLPSGMFMSDELRRRGENFASRDGYIKTGSEHHISRTSKLGLSDG